MTELQQFNSSDVPLGKGDVLVLGAGFSRSLTEKAPTMKGFLVSSMKIGTYQPDGRDIELEKVLHQYFGNRLEEVNIEELATFLADEFREDPPSSLDGRAAYNRLIWVITDTLADSWQAAKQSKSLPLVRSLARKSVAQEIPIITLNYDLIIDNLLHETGRWNAEYGYGTHLQTPFDEFLENVPINAVPIRFPSTVLLKLHGSLNWGIRLAPYPDGTHPVQIFSSDTALEAVRKAGTPVNFAAAAMDFSPVKSTPITFSIPGRPSMRFEPLIVPPYSQKQNASQHPLIALSWYLARGILSNAARILVAGYSLPPADFGIRDLLREAMGKHPKREVTVMIINPDHGVAERFQDLFAPFPFIRVIHLPYFDCVEWFPYAIGSDPPIDQGMLEKSWKSLGGLDLSWPVYSRPDGSYVVTYNRLPYHVIQSDLLYAQVREYDQQHPGAVQPEPTQ